MSAGQRSNLRVRFLHGDLNLGAMSMVNGNPPRGARSGETGDLAFARLGGGVFTRRQALSR